MKMPWQKDKGPTPLECVQSSYRQALSMLEGKDHALRDAHLRLKELAEARKGLIRQAKVYKQQLRGAGIEPIALYDTDTKPHPRIEAQQQQLEEQK